MKNMLKGKNLLVLAVVAGGAYWYWMKMKKDKAAKAAKSTTTPSEASWTGSYFNASGEPNVNASGVPRFGKAANMPSGLNTLGQKLTYGR
jgi:hypothetical protein